jgi:2-keto-4-pentenoate hydratase
MGGDAADFDPLPAATALLEARRTHRPAAPLADGIVPRTEAQGVLVQRAIALAVGDMPPAGFKIGATGQRMRAYLGMSGPAAGFMSRGGLHASGAVLRWDDFRHAGVECEIAVRLAADLPPGPCDAARAADAVGALFAGIEIVENRYGGSGADALARVGVATLVADQFFHAAAVLGAGMEQGRRQGGRAGGREGDGVAWRTLDLAALPGRITVDGITRGEGLGSELLGHPMAALAWLAGSDLAAAFGGLRAGQVVMLGSVTPPIWLDGPCGVTVAFDHLPPVSLRLT